MKTKLTLFITFFMSLLSFNACTPTGEVDFSCVADIAVTTLQAPSAVASGDVIEVVCIIRNVIGTVNGCSESGEGTARVQCAYSPTFKENFSDYEVFDDTTVDLPSFEAGEEQIDSPMEMPTNYGPGYYAMKVTVDAPNDDDSSNNSQAVAINAN